MNPDSLEKHFDLYLTLMFGTSGLSREERESIAVVVSFTNRCQYCVMHHAEALNHYWKDKDLIQKMIQNYRSVNLPNRKRTTLDCTIKLTKTPYAINKNDVDSLRKSGFSDEDILNINLITSYFNFVNRIALGLNVEFSREETRGYVY